MLPVHLPRLVFDKVNNARILRTFFFKMHHLELFKGSQAFLVDLLYLKAKKNCIRLYTRP